MATYLNYTFEDSEQLVNTYDELPLWSAPFGMLLLQHLEYTPNQVIVDIGCGTGFPLLELASRFGQSCTCYGVDVWTNANARTREKIKSYGLQNVELIEYSATAIPLETNSADMIVSNLGINNFEEPTIVFKECHRLLKQDGVLCITTNLYGHWAEFYKVFENVLSDLEMNDALSKLQAQQQARGTVEAVSKLFTDNGFSVNRCISEHFSMKFADGTAFLNHHFVKLGWLASWKGLATIDELEKIFNVLEHRLNIIAHEQGGLSLTVPMAFFEGKPV